MSKKKLTARQEQFCNEYIVDLNATQAAIRAGYAEKNAAKEASRLLGLSHIQEQIAERKSERIERTKVDADYVLNRLVQIDQMDVADILDDQGGVRPISQWPKIWRQFISGVDVTEVGGKGDDEGAIIVLKKIKWPDKVKNLELIGKHIDVQAFKERASHEHTGPNGEPLEMVTRVELVAATGHDN